MSKDFNAANFYKECEDLFHEYAKGVGFAAKGATPVADLKPAREVFVGTLLRDEKLSEACGDDPKIYYYNVIRYCLTAGIEYGAQWVLAPDGFDEEGYDEILYKNNVGRSSTDIKKEICDSPDLWRKFLIGLHRVWLAEMKSYLGTGSETEAIIQSCFAIFQLGVSIAIDKLDK